MRSTSIPSAHWALLLVAMLGLAPTAHAQGEPTLAAVRASCAEGWEQFRRGEHASALATLSAATSSEVLDWSDDAELVGACWYNRGRVEEALGHAREAIDAYHESLGGRLHEVVLDRLVALEPELELHLDEDRLEEPPRGVPLSRDLAARIGVRGGRALALMRRGGDDAVIVLEPGSRARVRLALRRAGTWRTAELGTLVRWNGAIDWDQRFGIEHRAAPARQSEGTFVIRHVWGGNTRWIEDGMPEYDTERQEVTLAWLRDGALVTASLGTRAAYEAHARRCRATRCACADAELQATDDARFTVTYSPECDSPRGRALVGTHTRDEWLSAPP